MSNKSKFLAWIGYMCFLVGGVMSIATFERFMTVYTQQMRYAFLFIVLVIFGVGILFEFWSHLVKK